MRPRCVSKNRSVGERKTDRERKRGKSCNQANSVDLPFIFEIAVVPYNHYVRASDIGTTLIYARARSQITCKVLLGFSLGDESKNQGKGRKMDRMESCTFKETVASMNQIIVGKKDGRETSLDYSTRGKSGYARDSIEWNTSAVAHCVARSASSPRPELDA